MRSSAWRLASRGRFGACLLILACAAVVAAPVGTARADEMHLSLAGLRQPVDTDVFGPDVEGWRWLVGQLGAAIAPPLGGPASTTGSRGFELRLETTITGLSDPEDCDPASGERCYWRRGTRGDAESTLATGNRFPRGNHVLTRVQVRKGLPYGVELGFSAGRLARTDTWVWGGEVKVALLEGFRSGLPALVPDLAIRGAVSTMTGDSQLNLTVATLDVWVSKDLVAGQTLILTPFLGPQLMWIFADSEIIDFAPGSDAWAECGALPSPPSPGDGSPIRCSGSGNAFRSHGQFPRIRAFRPRFVAGLQLRYRPLLIAAAVHWDLATPGGDDAAMDAPRQWSVAVSAGLRY